MGRHTQGWWYGEVSCIKAKAGCADEREWAPRSGRQPLMNPNSRTSAAGGGGSSENPWLKPPSITLVALAKRRGFVFQAGEIYGGSCLHGTTAPAELKETIRQQWQRFVRSRWTWLAWILRYSASCGGRRPARRGDLHRPAGWRPVVPRLRQDHLLENFEAKKAARLRAWKRLLARTVALRVSGLSRRILMKTLPGPG